MHDPLYRLSVAYQNVGYNQPTQTGFYLGDGMSPPPRPAIVTGDSEARSLRRPSCLDGGGVDPTRAADFIDPGQVIEDGSATRSA